MNNTEVIFKNEARKKLQSGVNVLADAVKSTLGAAGRNVVIEEEAPHVTKDGVTVARSINLKDPVENMGAQMVKEVAIKTGEEAGDGTTTATVLAQYLVNHGLSYLENTPNANPVEVKRGMEKALEDILKETDKIAIPIKDDNRFETLEKIATISANNDKEIGKIVATTIRTVGTDGLVTVEEGSEMEDTIDIVDGMELNRGYVSPYFVTDQKKMECVLENPYILITDHNLTSVTEVLDKLEFAAKQSRPFLIISPRVDGELLTTLIGNVLRGTIKACAIKAPEYGQKQKDVLQDIAVLTGGEFLCEGKGLKVSEAVPAQLGQAKKVIISKDKTLIINGNGNEKELGEYCDNLRSQIKECTNAYDKEQLSMRLAKLNGGIAVLHVGAATEVEMKEKKDRVDDALAATRAAMEEGYVGGGGSTFKNLRQYVFEAKDHCKGDKGVGYSLVWDSIAEPFYTIITNGGENFEEIESKWFHTNKDKSLSWGYNALTGEVGDMIEMDIIDPVKVLKTALRYAVSVASTILTVDCTINLEREESKCCK